MRVAKRLPALLVGVLLFSACSEKSAPPPIATSMQAGAVAATGVAGSVLAPSVTVADQNGKPMSGVAVNWAVPSGGGAVTTATTATNGSGVATAEWRLGTAVGLNRLTASSGSLAPVDFSVNGTVGPAAVVVVLPNNTAGGVAGTQVTPVPGVRVTDQFNNAVAGAQVEFSVASAEHGVVGGGSQVTGADGVARPTSWQLGPAGGTHTMTARAGNLSGNLTVTAVPPTATTLQASGTVGTTAVVGTSVTPAARVLDQAGRPMAGVTVTWAVTAGGGALASTVTTTDATGVARPGNWTLGTTTGVNTVVASSGTLTPVTFSLTAAAGAPAVLQPLDGNVTASNSGLALTPVPGVRVRDAFGNAVAGATVTFTAAPGNGTVTGGTQVSAADGTARPASWTVGATGGVQTMTATSGQATVGLNVTVTAAAFTMSVFGGNNTTCPGGSATCRFTVSVVTGAGNAAVGQTVQWRTPAGVELGSTMTDMRGYASFSAPPVAQGATGSVVARLPATGQEATFSYSGVQAGQYAITTQFIGTATPSQQAIFVQAAARWQQVITGELSNIAVGPGQLPAGACSVAHPEFVGTIDDLLIFIEVVNIDGVGQVLGQAGPCFTRTSNNLPVVGIMKLDAADVSNMEANGTLLNVVLHEMGHVLGLGVGLYRGFGLIEGEGTATSRFTGVRAYPGFVLAGGPLGNGVPLENCLLSNGLPRTGCGAGTQDSHWSEVTLGNELMTGYISAGANPMSAITIGALMDLGYQVDFGAADAFTFGLGSLRSGTDRGVHLHELPMPAPRRMPGT